MDQNGPDALPSFKAPKQHLGCLEAGVSSCSPGPKMAQDGSGDGPKAERPKTRRPKMPPKMAQESRKMAQDGPDDLRSSRHPNGILGALNLESLAAPQDGPRWLQDGPGGPSFS